MNRRAPGLSKSRFQLGLQCMRALWLRCHRPELADPASEGQRVIFADGALVGELARDVYPRGVLVEADHTRSAEALEYTAELLAGPRRRPIYEAAFAHDGVLVRADVIVPAGASMWDLVEVKSSNSLKPTHITDVAVQLHVLEGAGLEIRSAYVAHLNGAYVQRRTSSPDLDELFVVEDVTEDARVHAYGVPALIAEMKSMLADDLPAIEPGRHCDKPYPCAFKGFCRSTLPDFPVQDLPRVDAELLGALLEQGLASVQDVPDDFPGLTSRQRLVCSVHRSGETKVMGDIASALSRVRYPACFLDFETVRYAVPRFLSTRPHQNVPFQFSCHLVASPGSQPVHHEYLHEGGGEDPRPGLIRALLAATSGDGSIVVYHRQFEEGRIRELARDFPSHARQLEALLPRIFDLERVVIDHVCHPGFRGRSSLKAVLPALVPDLGYDGMAVADGEDASLAYRHLVDDGLRDSERLALLEALRKYCALDSLAMVRVFDQLGGFGKTA